jgi:hypothetical protein
MSSYATAVAAGIVTAAAKPNALIGHVEQIRCANSECDSLIPSECVKSTFDRETGVRHLKVFCDHCNKLFEGNFYLRNGLWELIDQVKEITDPRTLSSFKLRVDFLRGNKQQKSSASN